MAKKKGGLNGLPSEKKGKPDDWKGSSHKVVTGPKGVRGDDPTHKSKDKKSKDNPAAGGSGKGGKYGGTAGGGKDKSSGGKGDINQQMFDWQKKEAARAREEEKKRKERIEKGMGKINEAFKGFDPAFYAGREASFKKYYMDQLQPQFKDARDKLTFALARAGLGTTEGTIGSTAEATTKAENETGIANKTLEVGSRAAAATTNMQEQVAAEKSALINQLNQTAAAGQVGNQATAATAQLASAAPDYNWVPDVFYGAAQGVGGMVQAAQNAQYNNVFNNGGSGSGVNRGGTTIR